MKTQRRAARPLFSSLAACAVLLGLSACTVQGPGDDTPIDEDGWVEEGEPGDSPFPGGEGVPEGEGESGEEGPGSLGTPPGGSGGSEPPSGPQDPPPQGEGEGEGEPGAGEQEPPDPSSGHHTNTACFPGENEDGTTCLPTVAWSSSWGTEYQYPNHSSSAYAAPQRFVDLTQVDSSLKLAPNFSVGELMQLWKGDYGVFQSHMVEKLQSLRDMTGGALNINSGFRSPKYNKGVGGATYSRHMYGDAADMYSSVASLNTLRNRCNQLGADYVGMYSSHVHCDWRYHAKDNSFYGNAAHVGHGHHERSSLPVHTAELYVEDGVWTAPATGFDEGTPLRVWTAFDELGAEIETVIGEDYEAPEGAVSVTVEVGGQMMMNSPVD